MPTRRSSDLNAVLGNYSHAKTRNKLVYAVVYLLVNVVRTSRENDYLAVLTPCLSDYLPCLCRNIAVIAVKSLVSAVNRLGLSGNIFSRTVEARVVSPLV